MDWFFPSWCALLVILVIRGIIKSSRAELQLRRYGIQVRGVVVRNKFILGRISVFRPVVRFTTVAGEPIEAVAYGGWATAIPRFTKGETVAVTYDESKPTNFAIR